MKVSGIYSDGVILQRGKESLIYGMAEAGEKIQVTVYEEKTDCDVLDGTNKFEVCADNNGYWEGTIKPEENCGPYIILIKGENETITVKDVLFGDVFLLGGQSNMELTIGMIPDENERTLATADNNNIRMFAMPQEHDFSGKARILDSNPWICANKDTIAQFSAIGYYFAEEKYKNDKIPVGLIHTAVGGAPIEALMSEDNIRSCEEKIKATGMYTGNCNHGTMNGGSPVVAADDAEFSSRSYEHDKHRGCIYCYDELFDKTKQPGYVENRIIEDTERCNRWHEDVDIRDPGLKGEWYSYSWEDENDPKAESSIQTGELLFPGFLNNTKYADYFGTIWLQKNFYISEKHAKYGAKLYLGTLVDFDETYVNGIKVGQTDYRYPQRRYRVNEGTLKPGKNIVTVRLGMDGNVGGFLPDMPYKISIEADVCSSGCTSNCSSCGGDCINNSGCRNKRTETLNISLEGNWKVREGARTERLDGLTFFTWHPSALFNSMIAPLKGLSMSAILFYQGESNGFAPEYYDVLFGAMTDEWRELVGNVPMLYSEVAVYLGDGPEYETDSFEAVREVQREVENKIDDAYLIPITKLPAPYNELHPQNKADVAHMFYEVYEKCK